MGKITASISVSLDGFVAAPNDRPERPLGDGGDVLHHWLGNGTRDPRDVDVLNGVFDAMGALVMGRRGFDIAERHWGSEPPFRVPVFVLTHRRRDSDVRGATSFSFVTEGFGRAIEYAKDAAGNKDVALHGATPVQQAIRAGLLDELQIHLVPVLLGRGTRLLEHLGDAQGPLELLRVIDSPGVTHLKYRVVR